MMNKEAPFVRGFVADHHRHPVSVQMGAIRAHGLTDETETDRAKLVRDIREKDIWVVYRLFLLADPKRKRGPGGMRKSLYDTVDALEAKGGHVIELHPKLRTTRRKADRDAMMRDAIEDLARTRKHDRPGKPNIVWAPDQRTVIERHWFDMRHPTNAAACKAMKRDGVKCTTDQAYALVGKSGRRAGNPAFRATK